MNYFIWRLNYSILSNYPVHLSACPCVCPSVLCLALTRSWRVYNFLDWFPKIVGCRWNFSARGRQSFWYGYFFKVHSRVVGVCAIFEAEVYKKCSYFFANTIFPVHIRTVSDVSVQISPKLDTLYAGRGCLCCVATCSMVVLRLSANCWCHLCHGDTVGDTMPVPRVDRVMVTLNAFWVLSVYRLKRWQLGDVWWSESLMMWWC